MIAGLVSYVPEAWLAAVMADDRVGRHAVALQELLHEELESLQTAPQYVWERLADLLGDTTWSSLRHGALRSAHTSMTCIDQKTMRWALGRPWSLARGNVNDNLEALRAIDFPPETDPVTNRIQALARLGRNRLQVIDAVLLLSEISWTSKVAEEMHGSIAAIHRLQGDLDSESLSLRSFLHATAGRSLQGRVAAGKTVARLSSTGCDDWLRTEGGRCRHETSSAMCSRRSRGR